MRAIFSRLFDRSPRENVATLARLLGRPAPTTAAGLSIRGFELASLKAEISADIETTFSTSDGRRIAVEPGYRYSVKAAWRNFSSLFALAELERVGALDADGRRLLAAARGTRTLTLPLAELDAAAAAHISASAGLFVPGTLLPGAFPTLLSSADAVRQRASANAGFYRSWLARLAAAGEYRPSARPRALEIGTGSGYVAIGVASLGFEVTAVDNDYDGAMDSGSALARHNAGLAGCSIAFQRADATARMPFEGGSFDLIFSNSVIEHIAAIPALLAEMVRLLAPGGVAIHRYHPYFSPSGGHAFGTLDAPWAHARMDGVDMRRYVETLRPHEAPSANRWIAEALTREWPLARMQHAVFAAGLRPVAWGETPAATRLLERLDAQVVAQAMAVNPQIALADLVTDGVEMVLKRETG